MTVRMGGGQRWDLIRYRGGEICTSYSGGRRGLGTVGYFVHEAVYRHQMTNLSPKITANWVFASDHSRGGRFQSWAAWLSTKYSNFIAA
jgi:hypothetical protein